MNYKQLLIKYMAHVILEEGTDFMSDYRRSKHFTDAEWAELKKISADMVYKFTENR